LAFTLVKEPDEGEWVQMVKIGHNSVALAGEFAVLSQLAIRGFDANMTLGNTKSVDILVSDPETSSMFKIEVKTSMVEKPSHDKLFGTYFSWMMSEKQEHIKDPHLFYCFVTILKPAYTFRFFIVSSERVARFVKESNDFFQQFYHDKPNPMRKFMVGLEGPYKLEEMTEEKMPLASEYENRWDFQIT